MIQFRFITVTHMASGRQIPVTEKVLSFRTIPGAQRKLTTLMGANPKRDPDGTAVNPFTGDRLVFLGKATFDDVFPPRA